MRRNKKFGGNRKGVGSRFGVYNNRNIWLIIIIAVAGMLGVGFLGLMLWRWIFLIFFGLVLCELFFGYRRRL